MSEIGRLKTMNLQAVQSASKFRYRSKKVIIMRTQAARAVLFLFLSMAPALAQLPISAPAANTTEAQTPAVVLAQTPGQDTFSGSGTIDKPVPGVISISLLDSLDRGLKHNLGLLLSQQQTEQARAQYRRQLSALLPNVTG